MEEDRDASRSALFKVRNGSISTSSGNPGGRKMKLPSSRRHVFLPPKTDGIKGGGISRSCSPSRDCFFRAISLDICRIRG